MQTDEGYVQLPLRSPLGVMLQVLRPSAFKYELSFFRSQFCFR
uniref:Uncharacterized protein n=1 Tax=Arundo donax TaxID=35708 RepID=A0A0A9AUD3_ARUDO